MTSSEPQLEIVGTDVVAVGDFNPRIFRPDWFARMELLPSGEVEQAVENTEILHRDIVIFKTSWLSIQVTKERFSASTSDITKFLPLRDLVVGAFSCLSHTPIRAVGLNYNAHYRLSDEETWHSFGHFLIPKEPWGFMLNPGTRSVVVRGEGDEGGPKYVDIRVEPSKRIKCGVYLHINQHYAITKDDSEIGSAEPLVDIVAGQWADYQNFAGQAWNKLWSTFKGQ